MLVSKDHIGICLGMPREYVRPTHMGSKLILHLLRSEGEESEHLQDAKRHSFKSGSKDGEKYEGSL